MEDQILDYEEHEFNAEEYTASSGKRFANYIVDRVGVYLFLIAIGFMLDGVLSINNEDIFAMIILLLVPGYWIFFEYLFQKTPGKFLTGTKVIKPDGSKPSFLNIVGRTLCRFIPFEPFSFLGSKPVGWHDTISNTQVVEDRYVPIQKIDLV